MNCNIQLIQFLGIVGVLASLARGDILIEGSATALASGSGGKDRVVIDLSSAGVSSDTAAAVSGDTNATVTVTLNESAPSASIHIVHTLDSGPNAVSGSSSDGQFTFTLPAGTHFNLQGLLEQHSIDPGGGGLVRIEGPGGLWFQAGPNFSLPNHPIDFDAILSEGDLAFAGTYTFTWFHAANFSFSSAQTTANADFTLTLTLPGCNDADLNADGVLDFFDVSSFLVAFTAMDPAADLNNDGIFNFFDVSLFLTSFNAGCP